MRGGDLLSGAPRSKRCLLRAGARTAPCRSPRWTFCGRTAELTGPIFLSTSDCSRVPTGHPRRTAASAPARAPGIACPDQYVRSGFLGRSGPAVFGGAPPGTAARRVNTTLLCHRTGLDCRVSAPPPPAALLAPIWCPALRDRVAVTSESGPGDGLKRVPVTPVADPGDGSVEIMVCMAVGGSGMRSDVFLHRMLYW